MTEQTQTHCGLVAVIGAPNAGKSTLVNALVGQKVAIVSAKAQTTRARLLGIALHGETQMILVDTPGIFAPRRRLDRAMVRALWAEAVEGEAGRSKHPKSALQEWAAGNRRKAPEYALLVRSGPDHAASFTVRVSVAKVGEAEATASSKQEAETEAAKLFMERFG